MWASTQKAWCLGLPAAWAPLLLLPPSKSSDARLQATHAECMRATALPACRVACSGNKQQQQTRGLAAPRLPPPTACTCGTHLYHSALSFRLSSRPACHLKWCTGMIASEASETHRPSPGGRSSLGESAGSVEPGGKGGRTHARTHACTVGDGSPSLGSQKDRSRAKESGGAEQAGQCTEILQEAPSTPAPQHPSTQQIHHTP